ncbi:MAG: 16S rRNA (uracil(1498)-N(3))-methyltransferase [Sterolibacteriaceae bacterium]|nr:16S rRNA (uracil(1498)-N(3))-methyltransferase [Candidatus Methylophosphatis haderslevensis]
MIPRFFCSQPMKVGATMELPQEAAHHALRVLRLRQGAAIVLFDGTGGEYRASLLDEGRRARARIEAFDPIERESPLAVTLAQALPSGDKMDWIIEKAVELGVSAIVPLLAERSVVRLAGERAAKRVAHLNAVARAACEQCGRNRVPAVDAIVPLGAFLAAGVAEGAQRLVLSPGGTRNLAALAQPAHGIVLLAGPEGGWSDSEMAALRACGWSELTLGPRILRSETAGPAALAALQARWGDF